MSHNCCKHCSEIRDTVKVPVREKGILLISDDDGRLHSLPPGDIGQVLISDDESRLGVKWIDINSILPPVKNDRQILHHEEHTLHRTNKKGCYPINIDPRDYLLKCGRNIRDEGLFSLYFGYDTGGEEHTFGSLCGGNFCSIGSKYGFCIGNLCFSRGDNIFMFGENICANFDCDEEIKEVDSSYLTLLGSNIEIEGGYYLFIQGDNNKSIGDIDTSSIMGRECILSHSRCNLRGIGLKTSENGQFIIGRYGRPNSVSNTDENCSFYMACGEDETAYFGPTGGISAAIYSNNSPSNVMPTATGICESWSSNNVLFGRYYETSDSLLNRINKDEDLRGYFIRYDIDGKIEISESSHDAIGVVSNNISFLGGSDYLGWNGAILRDKFGDPIIKDGKQLLNPEFDSELNHVPREQRVEWIKVGVLGEVRVRQRDCIVGTYCICRDGIAVPYEDFTEDERKWLVLDVKDDIALIYLK